MLALELDAVQQLASFIDVHGGWLSSTDYHVFCANYPSQAQVISTHGRSLQQFCEEYGATFAVDGNHANAMETGFWIRLRSDAEGDFGSLCFDGQPNCPVPLQTFGDFGVGQGVEPRAETFWAANANWEETASPDSALGSAKGAKVAAALAIFIEALGRPLSKAELAVFCETNPSSREFFCAPDGLQNFCKQHGALLKYEADGEKEKVSLPSHCCCFLRNACKLGSACLYVHSPEFVMMGPTGAVHCVYGKQCPHGHWQRVTDQALGQGTPLEAVAKKVEAVNEWLGAGGSAWKREEVRALGGQQTPAKAEEEVRCKSRSEPIIKGGLAFYPVAEAVSIPIPTVVRAARVEEVHDQQQPCQQTNKEPPAPAPAPVPAVVAPPAPAPAPAAAAAAASAAEASDEAAGRVWRPKLKPPPARTGSQSVPPVKINEGTEDKEDAAADPWVYGKDPSWSQSLEPNKKQHHKKASAEAFLSTGGKWSARLAALPPSRRGSGGNTSAAEDVGGHAVFSEAEPAAEPAAGAYAAAEKVAPAKRATPPKASGARSSLRDRAWVEEPNAWPSGQAADVSAAAATQVVPRNFLSPRSERSGVSMTESSEGARQRCVCDLHGLLSKLPTKLFESMAVDDYAQVLHASRAQRLIFKSGRPMQVALAAGFLPTSALPQVPLSERELIALVEQLGFEATFEGGISVIPGSHHRLSLCRCGQALDAVTLHVVRQLPGVSEPIQNQFQRGSVLILGPGSSGKTTVLRDAITSLCQDHQVLLVDFFEELSAFDLGPTRKILPPATTKPADFIQKVLRDQSPEVIVAEFLDGDAAIRAAQLCFDAGTKLIAALSRSVGGLVECFRRFDDGLPSCFTFPFATVVALRRQLDSWYVYSPAGGMVCSLTNGRMANCKTHHVANSPALKPTQIIPTKVLGMPEEI